MPSLVGVFREPEYSPGRVDDDAAILERTREALAARGVTMTLGDVDLAHDASSRPRSWRCANPRAALAALDRAAVTVPVINAPDAIRACYRDETVARLADTAVPFPATRLIATASRPGDLADLAPCWVKRGDVHAMTSGRRRVCRDRRRRRGGARVSSHAAASPARRCRPTSTVSSSSSTASPTDASFVATPQRAEIPASLPVLWAAAHAGASALGLEVFGGDLVVTDEGKPVLVDLNDWPSFARCRDEAAEAIAGYVVDRLAAAWPSHPRTAWIRNPAPNPAPLFRDEQAVVAPGQQRIALLSELALASGRGATITDLDGNTYLDFFAGVAVASLGHAHPALHRRKSRRSSAASRSEASPPRTGRSC